MRSVTGIKVGFAYFITLHKNSVFSGCGKSGRHGLASICRILIFWYHHISLPGEIKFLRVRVWMYPLPDDFSLKETADNESLKKPWPCTYYLNRIDYDCYARAGILRASLSCVKAHWPRSFSYSRERSGKAN